MSKANDAWGIEVGANAIKAMRLVRKKDEIILADYEVLPFKKVLTTPDINVEEAIQVNLDQFLARHDVSKSTLMVSVTGSMAFAKFAKLPPVDPKSLPKIVAFEAIQQIPFPITEVEWDYQIFAQEDSPDVEVGIVAITKERVNRFLENYYAVGMEPDGIVLSPMAVYNAIVYDMKIGPDSEGMIIVDIGTSSTDVIIVENGQIWIRTLPIGGNNFTEALVRAFKLSFPKAERLKREAGTSKYARQIFQAMRPVFADFVQDMQRSLGFYQSINRDSKLTKLVGLGSTFRLPGMQKFLKQQLHLEVIRPDRYHNITIDGKQEADFAEHAMNMGTAYGLALQGLGVETVTTNLIPKPIVRKKMWKGKTRWFVASAALLFIASATVFARYEVARRGWESAKAANEPTVAGAEREANELIQDWNTTTAAADPRGEINKVRTVVNYRSIWPTLLLDVNEAVKALQPQEELLGNDYKQMIAIPPGDRKRIYIKQIDYKYGLYTRPSAASGPGAAAPAPASPAAPVDDAIWQRWPADAAIPMYTVTITGETTSSDRTRLLAGQLVNWIKSNAEREDRPYRVVVPTSPEPISIGQPVRHAVAGPAATTGAPPPGSGGLRPGGAMGASMGDMDSDAGGPSRMGVGGQPTRGMPPRIGPGIGASPPPSSATTEINRPNIYAGALVTPFTLTFQVHLLVPDDVRTVESILSGEIPPIDRSAPAEPGGEPAQDAAALRDDQTRTEDQS